MSDGIWQIDGDRKTQLSANPDALNTRTIARAFRQALADVEASREEAKCVADWYAWSRDLAQYAGTDAAALAVLEAVIDGAQAYAQHGAPRAIVPVDVPDEPGAQDAF